MSLVSPMRWMLALVAVGVLSSSAQAQGRPQGGRGNFGGGFQQSPSQEKLGYLANEAVQKELELADDQKADLKKIAEEAATKGRELFSGGGDFRNLSEEERNKRMAEFQQKRETLGKDMLKKVEGVLLPHQMDRLQEIWVQVKGTAVLVDPEISKQLAVTDTQKEKITEIRDAARREMFQGGGGGQGGNQSDADRAAARERLTKMGQERDTKVVAVLTADQKAKYEKMKGEAFEEAANLRFSGFGGGGGARPGQPGQGGQQQRRRPGGDGNNNDR